MAVAAVVVIFFLSRWVFEGAYFRKDLVFITVPLENLYSRLQDSGESLLWAPELAGGYPLLATGQLGFWYPPHWLLRYFLPGVWVLNLSLLGHALLGGFGMFGWLRHNGLRETAVIVGSILFPLGATMVGKYESLNLILPFMWMPWLLLLLQRFMETGRAKYFLGWIGVSSLSILVGHAQLAVNILILEGIFVLCLAAIMWRRWLRALATLGGVALILGLTSFYWLPILDHVPYTDRAGGTLKPNEQGMFDSQFTPEAFLGLVIPHPFGHHETYRGPSSENELSSYYGPAALAAAAIGLLATRRSFKLWGVAVVFIGLGLSLATGGYSPLFRWLVDHGWTYFNLPARFFFYTHVGLVLLAAAGVEVCERYLKRPVWRGALVVGIVAPALWVSWGWHEGVPWQFTGEPILAQRLRQEPGAVRVLAGTQLDGIAPEENFGIKRWNPICSKCRYQQLFVSSFQRFDGVALKVHKLSDVDGTLTLRLYTKEGELLREAHLSHRDIVDSQREMLMEGWNTWPFEPVQAAENEEFYFEVTSDMDQKLAPRLWIHTNPRRQYDPTGRLFNCTSGTCTSVLDADAAFKVAVESEAVPYWDALAPNAAAGFGLGSTQWAGALPIRQVKEFMSPFDTWGDPWRGGARTMMNRFGTTHLIGVFPPHRQLALEGFSWLATAPHGDAFLQLYRNEQVFPRLHFAQAVRAFDSSIDQVNLLLKTDPKDQRTVLADIREDMLFDVSGSEAHFVRDERTEVQVKTEQRADGFLVLRDVLLPGWAATVDNRPAQIYRVDGVFRGLFVPAGTHTIKFAYKPLWVKRVMYIESVALAVLGVLVVLVCLASRAAKEESVVST